MYKNKVLDLVTTAKRKYLDKMNGKNEISYKFEEWVKYIDDETINDICSRLEINQNGYYVLFRYGDECFEGEEFWNKYDGLYKECRSIIIDINKLEIVILPFDKFFNIGELKESSIENISDRINKANKFEISNKLDGSMQCLRYYNGEYILTGSRAISASNSWRIVEGKKMITDNIKKLAKENPNLTFIFEFIHMEDFKVVKYSKEDEGLYLIGIRNVETGETYNYKKMIDIGIKYGVATTRLENLSFKEILKYTKEIKGYEKEGWVLNIDGYMVKLKTDDYVGLHRIINVISSSNVIIKNMAEGKIDDLISKMPEGYKEMIIDKVKEIHGFIEKINFQIDYYYNIAPKDKIKFYKFTSNCIPKHIVRFVNCKYSNIKYNILTNRFGVSVKYKWLKEWSEYNV